MNIPIWNVLPSSFKEKVALRVARTVEYLLYLAVDKGLDQRREWPWNFKANFNAEVIQPFNVKDFLLLVDAVSGRKEFADSTEVTVRSSIIIPVFNKVDYTFQCIRSLMQEVNLQENEIIIINNASSDETERVLSYLQGVVQVIHNRENNGFVQACNQAAAVARGKYLVFLNNDTVILPGWLEHLTETVENNSSVGAVGSQLIYPDGHLQEAGAIMWKDGTTTRYGQFEKPEHERFNRPREVDYCSGASLLVRRELFDQLGGFDELYAPAYYEDVDLCFGIRSLGFKTMYQPASRLIHYESVTAGTDLIKGLKRSAIINRTKFVEKWQDVLEREHLAYDEYSVELAANRLHNLRISSTAIASDSREGHAALERDNGYKSKCPV